MEWVPQERHNKYYENESVHRILPCYCGFYRGDHFSFHNHVDFYEFAIISNGSFTHYFEGTDEETQLQVGDIIYVRPGEYHAMHTNEPESMYYVIIFRQDWFEAFLANRPAYRDFYSETPFLHKTLPSQQNNYLLYLANAFSGYIIPPNCDLLIEQLLSALLLACYQEINSRSYFGVDRYINHLIYQFNSYQGLDVDITEIYGRYPMSQTTLINRFRAITGMTIVEYRHQKRMEYAAHLLLLGNYQIAAVSNAIGISSLSYFSALFKKHYGMTPKQYQMAHHRKT